MCYFCLVLQTASVIHACGCRRCRVRTAAVADVLQKLFPSISGHAGVRRGSGPAFTKKVMEEESQYVLQVWPKLAFFVTVNSRVISTPFLVFSARFFSSAVDPFRGRYHGVAQEACGTNVFGPSPTRQPALHHVVFNCGSHQRE